MLGGLWHDAFVGGNDEQRDVDAGRAREHVFDKAFVAGDVHHARLDVARERQGRKAKIDRDAAAFFLFPAVGVDPGERLYERGLPVVDVPCRTDYEPCWAGPHARRSQMSMALDFGSFPFRPVSSRW